MKTILVVDDEPKIVQIARDYLEHAGFAVLTAHDGKTALAMVRASKPDLIVLDVAAFTEYAADRPWVASHLMQLCGISLIVMALILLSRRMSTGRGASGASLGVAGAVASLAVAAALQAVDGIALKRMVDRWAAASVVTADKDILFAATFAVRQIEIGLASMFGLLMGMTATIYGVALISDRRFPRWLGGLAILGGLPLIVAGMLMAYTGFSALAMTINLSASALLLLWIVVVGVWMGRLASAKRLDAAMS